MRDDLRRQIVTDYWDHIEFQTESMVMDWFVAYWRLADQILTDEDKKELLSYSSLTPEILHTILKVKPD